MRLYNQNGLDQHFVVFFLCFAVDRGGKGMVDGVEQAQGCGCVISEQVLESCRLVREGV